VRIEFIVQKLRYLLCASGSIRVYAM